MVTHIALTKTVLFFQKAKRFGDGESPKRVGNLRTSLLSCPLNKDTQVGQAGSSPLKEERIIFMKLGRWKRTMVTGGITRFGLVLLRDGVFLRE